MKTPANRFLYWTPRILCLLFAGFISLFALDVFQENHGFWNTALALMVHLIPTAILLILLALAWRWEWLGSLFFPGLGAFYIIAFWGRFPWATYLIIAGPLVLVGVLFLLGWLWRGDKILASHQPDEPARTH
jgi:hypothetical protein